MPATPATPATLYVVATPLGHLGDLSHRAEATLRSVPVVAAEDTRRIPGLLSHLDAHPRSSASMPIHPSGGSSWCWRSWPIRSGIDNRDPASHNLHRNEGYHPLRYHWRMEIVLDGPQPEPKFPEGMELRPFIKGEHDIPVWQAQNEAFRDHWGHSESTEEDYQRWINSPSFQPHLWQVAWAGDEVAGMVLNFIDQDSTKSSNGCVAGPIRFVCDGPGASGDWPERSLRAACACCKSRA